MEIMIAQHSGFCEGVQRAYRIALEQTKLGRPLFMLGNLVHNTQVVNKFKELGTITVKELSEIPDQSKGILLISAHGVPPEIYAEGKAKGLDIIDTTCPWVKKAQQLAHDLAAEGRTVIIAGDKGHPEVKGLVGWSQGKAVIIEKAADIKALSLAPSTALGLIAQTTQAEKHFQNLAALLKEKFRDVKIFNTICGATAKRQQAAVELAKTVDLLLVIGDQLSANTKRLTELCAHTGTPTYQIQNVGELKSAWLLGKQRVGITAGASTPEWVIKEVLAALRG